MLTYADYLPLFRAAQANPGGGESGSGSAPMSEELWDTLTDDQKWDAVGNGLDLMPGDPKYDEVRDAILAAHPGSDVRSVMVSRAPGGADPAKTIQLPDGTYAWSVDNSVHPKDSDNWKLALAGIGTVLGGAALYGGIAGATAAPGYVDAIGSTVEGANAGASLTGPVTAAAPAAPGAFPTEPMPDWVNAPFNPGTPADINIPGAPAAPAAPAPVAPGASGPAPVFDHSTIARTPGLVDNALSAPGRAMGWYDSLSPASRLIVNAGLSTGAQAVLGARAQREAQRAADERQDRAEEDRRRRHQVPTYTPGFFQPKGLIDGNMGG